MADYVFASPTAQELLEKLRGMMDFLLPHFVEEGKSALVIAVGCTGGRHRSVAVTHALCEYIQGLGYRLPVSASRGWLRRVSLYRWMMAAVSASTPVRKLRGQVLDMFAPHRNTVSEMSISIHHGHPLIAPHPGQTHLGKFWEAARPRGRTARLRRRPH